MRDDRDELKKDIELFNLIGLKTVIRWVAVLFGLTLVLTIVYHGVSPTWRSLETKGTESGYAAVSSKKKLMLKLQQDWTKLESQRVAASRADPELAQTYAAQQTAIVNRMKIEAATLPRGEVPSEVQGLLH